MANEKTYYDTDYTYIKPVRHFKSNDPYYYEVDNIPIKQLEENTNFLKDQVDGLLTRGENNTTVEIGREGFSELKPYSLGNDRKVRVKPGRYTARVNNAYDITPLQVIEQVYGFTNTGTSEPSAINVWSVETNKGPGVSAVLEQIREGFTAGSLNMNGLAERAFVFPIADEDVRNSVDQNLLNITSPGFDEIANQNANNQPLYPNYVGAILQHTTVDTTRNLTLLRNIYSGGATTGYQQGRLESEFIKRWRGVTRTTVVDVPNELEITIPDFDEDDFYCFDSDGERQDLYSNQRIDLLFIYTKGVDETTTTLAKFENGTAKTIQKAELGIVKGAGIGMSLQTANDNTNRDDRVDLQTSIEGTPIMVAHPGDHGDNAASSTGFYTSSAGYIRGSFPSPDDLMNLAPVIAENLETTSLALIGQSILPIAYIRVQRDMGPVADVINSDDIIDIRPFFRTTELAYNERAGIAAATPQVSIANPVVTEAHLDKVKGEIYKDLRGRIGVGTANPANNTPPQIQAGATTTLAAGVITGGLLYGPEGALARQTDYAGEDSATLITKVQDEFGYFPGTIKARPMWDKSSWYREGNFQGDKATDHINVANSLIAAHGNPDAYRLPPFNIESDPGQGNLTDDSYRGNLGNIGMGLGFRMHHTKDNNDWRTTIQKKNEMYYVSKRIYLDGLSPTTDYHVNVNYLNCIPATSMELTTGHGERSRSTQPAGIWVVKHPKYFIINVCWNGDMFYSRDRDADKLKFGKRFSPWNKRDIASDYCGFMLPDFDADAGGADFKKYPPVLQYDRQGGRGGDPNKPGSDGSYFLAGSRMLGDVNEGANASEETPVNYFHSITPILYPSVTFEVVGFEKSLYNIAHGSDGQALFDNDGSSTINILTGSTS